jgi:hypothetical protein
LQERNDSWGRLARFLLGLSGEERARLSRYGGLGLPEGEDPEGVEEVLRAHGRETGATPSGLLATLASGAAYSRDTGLALHTGRAALELAESAEDRQLAHVCLAQAHFQNRRDPRELEGFVEHCRAAVDLGHAGTFCYERLAALYEYRQDLRAAAEISRRAAEVLEASGDALSAARFRKRLRRLSRKAEDRE